MLTINKASQIIGICRDTLMAWEDSGKLVPIRTKGGHRRYTHEQLLPFLNERQNRFISKFKEKYGDNLSFEKTECDK